MDHINHTPTPGSSRRSSENGSSYDEQKSHPPMTHAQRIRSGYTDVGDKFELSEDYKLLAVTPEEFGGVIKERIARLQDRLPALGAQQLRQARADIVYLRSILDGEESGIAQARAGGVFSAKH